MWLKFLLEIALFIVGMLILTIFIIAIMFVVDQVKLRHRKMDSSIIDIHAKVLSKRMDNCYIKKKRKTVYYVTYETDDGDTIELLVDKWTYLFIEKEDVGILTFQGAKFISFQSD